MSVDSNKTGLRYAEETYGSIGSLPGSPIWYPLEPNSYAEFGAQVKTLARNPLTASRQRKKGLVVDVDAAAGFQSDWVQRSLADLMQGFMFADWRKKTELATTTVTSTLYNVASGGTGFVVNSLLFAEGHAVAGNNGLKVVTASASGTVTCAGLAAETSPATAKITRVGFQGASGDITVTVTGGVATIGSTTVDFTTLGLIPGEWLFIGGDAAGEKFATAANNGFARMLSVAAHAIVLDRQPGTMVTDTGSGKTIRLFFGHVIKNESNPALIKTRSYQLERSLSTGGYDYIVGAVANTLELGVGVADKITADLGFIGMDVETRTTGAGAKSGTRPSLPIEEAFNSTSDFSRLRVYNQTGAADLTTYLTELSLSIDNGVTPNKAISRLGAIDVSAGDFMVSGSVTAYFTDVAIIDAVRANPDVSLDFAVVKSNAGWLFDVPLVALGDGRLNIEKDKPITLPLSLDAAAHGTFDHTLLVTQFVYLPTAAQ